MKISYSFLIICILNSCTTPLFYSSQWHGSESNTPISFFHKANKISLSVSNNSTHLFIDILSTDIKTLSKIKKLGLSLWLSKGKKPLRFHGIHYPLPFDNTEGKVALEGFMTEDLVAVPFSAIEPLKISSTLTNQQFHYKITIPLESISLTIETKLTLSLASFTKGKTEQLSGLTSAQAIERRLDEYKAKPQHSHSENEIFPFFTTFTLAKTPNKNP